MRAELFRALIRESIDPRVERDCLSSLESGELGGKPLEDNFERQEGIGEELGSRIRLREPGDLDEQGGQHVISRGRGELAFSHWVAMNEAYGLDQIPGHLANQTGEHGLDFRNAHS